MKKPKFHTVSDHNFKSVYGFSQQKLKKRNNLQKKYGSSLTQFSDIGQIQAENISKVQIHPLRLFKDPIIKPEVAQAAKTWNITTLKKFTVYKPELNLPNDIYVKKKQDEIKSQKNVTLISVALAGIGAVAASKKDISKNKKSMLIAASTLAALAGINSYSQSNKKKKKLQEEQGKRDNIVAGISMMEVFAKSLSNIMVESKGLPKEIKSAIIKIPPEAVEKAKLYNPFGGTGFPFGPSEWKDAKDITDPVEVGARAKLIDSFNKMGYDGRVLQLANDKPDILANVRFIRWTDFDWDRYPWIDTRKIRKGEADYSEEDSIYGQLASNAEINNFGTAPSNYNRPGMGSYGTFDCAITIVGPGGKESTIFFSAQPLVSRYSLEKHAKNTGLSSQKAAGVPLMGYCWKSDDALKMDFFPSPPDNTWAISPSAYKEMIAGTATQHLKEKRGVVEETNIARMSSAWTKVGWQEHKNRIISGAYARPDFSNKSGQKKDKEYFKQYINDPYYRWMMTDIYPVNSDLRDCFVWNPNFEKSPLVSGILQAFPVNWRCWNCSMEDLYNWGHAIAIKPKVKSGIWKAIGLICKVGATITSAVGAAVGMPFLGKTIENALGAVVCSTVIGSSDIIERTKNFADEMAEIRSKGGNPDSIAIDFSTDIGRMAYLEFQNAHGIYINQLKNLFIKEMKEIGITIDNEEKLLSTLNALGGDIRNGYGSLWSMVENTTGYSQSLLISKFNEYNSKIINKIELEAMDFSLAVNPEADQILQKMGIPFNGLGAVNVKAYPAMAMRNQSKASIIDTLSAVRTLTAKDPDLRYYVKEIKIFY